MGFFGADHTPDSKVRIPHRHLEEHFLKKIPRLEHHEREHIMGLFDQYQGRDITKRDAEKILKDLRNDTGDGIHHEKIDAVHDMLMGHFDGTQEG